MGLAPKPFDFGNATWLDSVVTGGRLGRGARKQPLPSWLPQVVLHRSAPPTPLALSLTFEGGTPCDILSNVTRSSTVEVSCGPRDELIDVLEDSTCHYLVRVNSAALCGHSTFVAAVETFTRVDLRPVGTVGETGSASGSGSGVGDGLGLGRGSGPLE